MPSTNYATATEYELLAQSVYQEIISKETSGATIQVLHNQDVLGRSGAKHQVDILWRFRLAGVDHQVFVECKNYARTVEIGHVRNFFGALHDIGNAKGIVVTRESYQAGAKTFADHYGIDLKLLRKPTEADWQGRLKDLHIRIHLRWLKSTDDSPIVVKPLIEPVDDAQKARLATHNNQLSVRDPPSLQLRDSSGRPTSEQFRHWLPNKIPVLKYEGSGPHAHTIDTAGAYLLLATPDGDELVRVNKIDVNFNIEELANDEVVIHGEEVVDAILKDFLTGAVEHVKRR